MWYNPSVLSHTEKNSCAEAGKKNYPSCHTYSMPHMCVCVMSHISMCVISHILMAHPGWVCVTLSMCDMAHNHDRII